MFGNGVQRVMGAGRVEAALIADERAECVLIAANEAAKAQFRNLFQLHGSLSPDPKTANPTAGAVPARISVLEP